MWALGGSAIMLDMTRPNTSSKVMLLPGRRVEAAEPGVAVPVRRYRLARLRLDGRAADPSLRFAHLKRVYD
jgi:hypothetical protein